MNCLNTGIFTHASTRGHKTHIDLSLVTDNLALYSSWYTLNNAMGSDHVPIVITLNDCANQREETLFKLL
jgi:hypothetical protein